MIRTPKKNLLETGRGEYAHPTPAPRLPLPAPRAFTLVELMISIAMVLILLVGIDYVFRIATDAVDAGNTLTTASDESQAAQTLVFNDFRNVTKDPPCFIIASQIVPQYLNAADAQTGTGIAGAGNGLNPLVVVTDNIGTKQTLSPTIYDYRSHRADLIKFFAHGFYRRHTAPDGSFTSTDTADDVFITLGHAALPYTSGNGFVGPTSNTVSALQRVGAYASDWVLARSIMLLKDPSSIPANTDPYYFRSGSAPSPYTANLTPLGYNSLDNNTTPGSVQTTIQSSRYDLAGVTIEQFRRDLVNEILNWRNGGFTGSDLWWNPLVYNVALTQNTATVPQTFGPPVNSPYTATYNNAYPNYLPVPSGDQYLARPQTNPLIQHPLTAQAISAMSPYFLQHCSQFIVEYAGDYLQEDAAGDITGIGPKGQIDYYVDANGNKHIRWYGMPRSSTGVLHPDGRGGTALIRGYTPGDQPTAAYLSYFTDVIPLRDYYSMYFAAHPPANPSSTGYYAPPWEVDVNFAPCQDYGVATNASSIYSMVMASLAGTGPSPRYACAWYNDMPAMIRILIKVDDPNNKIKDGPWYEYVFRLK